MVKLPRRRRVTVALTCVVRTVPWVSVTPPVFVGVVHHFVTITRRCATSVTRRRLNDSGDVDDHMTYFYDSVCVR